jgi:type II secretory pathway pseudopilin PulG
VPLGDRLPVIARPSIRRARGEQGQTLIELLIAMIVLSIAVGGLMAAFASSILTMNHAGKEGTALALADRQMETYRTLSFPCVTLTPSSCPSFAGFPNPYAGTQTVATTESPDHRAYTVTTAITGTTQKQVTVRVAPTAGGPDLARISSVFSALGSS